MFLVDTEEGRIVADEELKLKIATEQPYRQWLNDHLLDLASVGESAHAHELSRHTVLQRQQAFGYTFEDLRIVMTPMARDGVEAVGSMGCDTPLAVLSSKPQLLYNYFQQLFAQVTNPPIDSIREELVTSALTTIGSERNLLKPKPMSCNFIKLPSPILTNEEFAKLKYIQQAGFKSVTLPILFKAADGEAGLARAMDDLCARASSAVEAGANILILSDRGVDVEMAAIPALLAVAGLHHHLIREGTRTRVGLVLESGEPREVHHFSLLIGYGVGAINPYVAFETIDSMVREGLLVNIAHEDACKNYVKAAVKGVVKVISKMGISTIQSYRGAQIFEAIGLHPSVVEKYFTGTASRVGGIGLDVIAREVRMRHAAAFPDRQVNGHVLEAGGNYQWRADGEHHLFNPQTVHQLQTACRNADYKAFKNYSHAVNDQSKKSCTLRGLLELKVGSQTPVPIEEVEPLESLFKRFKSGAMSYGSISQEAHEALAVAMNRIGGKSNTGEGGEAPARYQPEPNGDSKNSAIKQVASARFGVTSLYLVMARELQIKMAQGAKPGEGHHCRRRGQGPCRRGVDQRSRWRHRRLASDEHQARRHPVGAGPGRNPSNPRPEQSPQPHHGGNRRPIENRTRRGRGRSAGGGGIWLRHRSAGVAGLHYDAGLPPGHLPGRRSHAKPVIAQEFHRRSRPRGQFHELHRTGGARVDGAIGFPHHQRNDWPDRPPRTQGSH